LCGLFQCFSIPSCAAHGLHLKSLAAAHHCVLARLRGIAHSALDTNSTIAENCRGRPDCEIIAEFITGTINPIFTCCRSCPVRVPCSVARFCYPEPCNWF
jgi:hypothetical protein